MKNTKHFYRWLAVFTVLVAVCAAVVYFTVLPKAADAPAEAKDEEKKSLPVSIMVVQSKPFVEVIKNTGTLAADEMVDLSFESSGRITQLNIIEGQKVKKGDVIAKINDAELQAQLIKFQIQLKLAQDREQRQHSLLEREAISRESYEQSLTEVQVLKAEIMQLEAKIEKMSIFAPFEGTIGLRYVSEGAFVQAGTPIAQFIKIKPLKVEFSVNERYTNVIKRGTSVLFKMDDNNTTYQAAVYAIEPSINAQTRTMTARAIYANSREELKPGRFVTITVPVQHFNNAIAVPSEAIIPEMDGAKVFLYKSGKAMPVNVTLGIRTEEEVQIIQGLHSGDTLITSGVLQLRYGLPVAIYNQQ